MDALSFAIGFFVGAAGSAVVLLIIRRQSASISRAMAEETERRHREELDRAISQLKESFAALSRDALVQNSQTFVQLAGERFERERSVGTEQVESKKKLIDAHLEKVSTKLTELHTVMQSIEQSRRQSQGSLQEQLKNAVEVTGQLRDTTANLREALSSSKARGQWGERMADDVLRLAGLKEGVNYVKQTALQSGTRPDFTFMLPGDIVVHMDVKFPLANYLRYLECKADDPSSAECRKQFLRDVKQRVKEVTTRDYIDPAGGTTDCVLLFIPNEHIYGFIHEHDAQLLDEALRQRVILCSPITLFAVLAVIRRAVESFRLRKASDEILQLLGEFKKQWDKYGETVDTLGKRLESAVSAFHDLTTTRTRALERHLLRIDDLQAKADEKEPAATPAGLSDMRLANYDVRS